MRQTIVSCQSLLRVGHQEPLHQVPGLAGHDGELRDVDLVLALQSLRHCLEPEISQSAKTPLTLQLRELLNLKFFVPLDLDETVFSEKLFENILISTDCISTVYSEFLRLEILINYPISK